MHNFDSRRLAEASKPLIAMRDDSSAGATIAESLLPSEEKNSTADGWLMPTIRVSLEVVLRIKLEVENGLACVCGPRRARQSFAVQ